MRTSVAGILGGNLPANHAIVPAAHFYADIRCRSPLQEPSSKSHLCSCSPSLCGHPLPESPAGTFQQITPLFLQLIFQQTSVAGIPGRNLPTNRAVVPAACFFAGIRGNLAHDRLRTGGGWQQSEQKRLSRAVQRYQLRAGCNDLCNRQTWTWQ